MQKAVHAHRNWERKQDSITKDSTVNLVTSVSNRARKMHWNQENKTIKQKTKHKPNKSNLHDQVWKLGGFNWAGLWIKGITWQITSKS